MKRSPYELPLALLGIALVYLLGAWWFAREQSIWSPDCGARLVQVQSILENSRSGHGLAWWVPYPAASLDPQHQNSPLYFFEYVHNGKTYIFYSFLFALLSAGMYQLLGHFGLSVLPIAGGLLTAWATYKIGEQMRLRSPLAPTLLVALATPVALYSFVFWDQVVIAGIAVAAITLALRGVQSGKPLWWLAAGAAIGAGVWLHEILLPLVPALLVGAWYTRRQQNSLRAGGFLLASLLLFLIPLALVNQSVYGSMAGPHLSNNRLGSAGSVTHFLLTPAEWGSGALYTLFAWGDTNPGFTWELVDWMGKAMAAQEPDNPFRQEITASLWMTVPTVLWMVLALGGWARKAWPLSLLALAGIVGSGAWVLMHDNWPHGPFLACPLLAIGLAARPKGENVAARFVALVAIVFTLLNLLKPTLGGTEWGSRHLLAVTPLLLLLGALAVEELLPVRDARLRLIWLPGARALLAGFAALGVMSVALLVHGVVIVHTMHVRNRALGEAILATPDDVVVTRVWWATMNGAAVYPKKQILYADDAQHPAAALFARLRQNHVVTYSLVGYSANDLSMFARLEGYVPIAGTDHALPMGLWTRRYLLVGTARTGMEHGTPSVWKQVEKREFRISILLLASVPAYQYHHRGCVPADSLGCENAFVNRCAS